MILFGNIDCMRYFLCVDGFKDGSWCLISFGPSSLHPPSPAEGAKRDKIQRTILETINTPKNILYIPYPHCIHIPQRRWSGGAMVLGKFPMPERPTNLDCSRARAYCTCSGCRWGLFGHVFSRLSFLSSFSLSLGDGPILTKILSQRAVKPKTTNQPTTFPKQRP